MVGQAEVVEGLEAEVVVVLSCHGPAQRIYQRRVAQEKNRSGQRHTLHASQRMLSDGPTIRSCSSFAALMTARRACWISVLLAGTGKSSGACGSKEREERPLAWKYCSIFAVSAWIMAVSSLRRDIVLPAGPCLSGSEGVDPARWSRWKGGSRGCWVVGSAERCLYGSKPTCSPMSAAALGVPAEMGMAQTAARAVRAAMLGTPVRGPHESRGQPPSRFWSDATQAIAGSRSWAVCACTPLRPGRPCERRRQLTSAWRCAQATKSARCPPPPLQFTSQAPRHLFSLRHARSVKSAICGLLLDPPLTPRENNQHAARACRPDTQARSLSAPDSRRKSPGTARSDHGRPTASRTPQAAPVRRPLAPRLASRSARLDRAPLPTTYPP